MCLSIEGNLLCVHSSFRLLSRRLVQPRLSLLHPRQKPHELVRRWGTATAPLCVVIVSSSVRDTIGLVVNNLFDWMLSSPSPSGHEGVYSTVCGFLCLTGALQQHGRPIGLGHQPQRVQIPPAVDTGSRLQHSMAGRLQPAGMNIVTYTSQFRSIPGPGPKELYNHTGDSGDASLLSSLSLRAGGCGSTVRVSIT